MPKFDKNIKLWLTNGTEIKTFYGFNNKSQEQSVEGLIKRMLIPNRFKLPIARLYINSELNRCFVQGNEVKSQSQQENWYGPEISAFKIKLILIENNEFVGPFYSNSLINIDKQYKTLIEQYCKGIYKNKFKSALIFDLRDNQDELVTQIVFKDSKYIVNKFKKYDFGKFW